MFSFSFPHRGALRKKRVKRKCEQLEAEKEEKDEREDRREDVKYITAVFFSLRLLL